MSETAEDYAPQVKVSPPVKQELIRRRAQLEMKLGRRMTFNEVIEQLLAAPAPAMIEIRGEVRREP
jgi:hypothetical protein